MVAISRRVEGWTPAWTYELCIEPAARPAFRRALFPAKSKPQATVCDLDDERVRKSERGHSLLLLVHLTAEQTAEQTTKADVQSPSLAW